MAARLYICGDMVPVDGLWHYLGYFGIVRQCEGCSYAATWGMQSPGEKTRYRCAKCVPEESLRGARP